jgi:hypothetical protein
MPPMRFPARDIVIMKLCICLCIPEILDRGQYTFEYGKLVTDIRDDSVRLGVKSCPVKSSQ